MDPARHPKQSAAIRPVPRPSSSLFSQMFSSAVSRSGSTAVPPGADSAAAVLAALSSPLAASRMVLDHSVATGQSMPSLVPPPIPSHARSSQAPNTTSFTSCKQL
eukprot:CAMPEP_0117663928 /NCGR_PEP_ID=MMETSP0804-20121206/8902_1 /TAXON_ID=1074897 /ORGANISM="Tetraselmis astigmatica, Strain CCMP880" /LENGTH=104 /DNA_ID=CAMNT_0005471035 /DNA_START=116 /DNA_END=430 /DNA_ORIENTATION=-